MHGTIGTVETDCHIPSESFLSLTNSRRKKERLKAKRRLAGLKKPGRPRKYEGDESTRAATALEAFRNIKRKYRTENIAVLDFETDPFDNINQTEVYPFVAVLYRGRDIAPVIIWEENHEKLVDLVCDAIEALPEPHTIYAHNGGRFDYMYLFRRLSGSGIFKGRSLMHAQIGQHRLRDSFHLVPEKLAAIQKEEFDYNKMKRGKRRKHKQQIIDYCLSDCVYVYDVIKTFLAEYGQKMSIGQASLTQLKKAGYKFDKLSEMDDGYLRPFYLGGRVECLRGRGHWHGDYKLYDVNSMYPSVMADYEHPISSAYTTRTRNFDLATSHFIELSCKSDGAFLARADEENENDEDGLTSHWVDRRSFRVTRWEYDVAMLHGLLSDVEIHRTITFDRSTNFAAFVHPLYLKRRATLDRIEQLKQSGQENTPEWFEQIRWSIFYKLLLNNSYGKLAQNPRKFKEVMITGPRFYPYFNGEPFPSPDDLQRYFDGGHKSFWGKPLNHDPDCKHFAPEKDFEHSLLWERDNRNIKGMFNNVACGASITGAARARLLDAICRAKNPLYCDTDSIICEELSSVELHPSKLGAWKLEAEISEVMVAGKKLYGYRLAGASVKPNKPDVKTKAKGASAVSWEDLTKVVYGGNIVNINKAPTLEPDGNQYYVERTISATSNIVDWSKYNGVTLCTTGSTANQSRRCA